MESGPELHTEENTPGIVLKLSNIATHPLNNQDREPDGTGMPPISAPPGLDLESVISEKTESAPYLQLGSIDSI